MMQTNDVWIISEVEKAIIASLVVKGKQEEKRNEKFAVIDFASFYRLFTDDEVTVMRKYLTSNPTKNGFALPYLGLENTPQDLLPISNQKMHTKEGTITLPVVYLPSVPLAAYTMLNMSIHKELGKKLLLEYGYRSPARQVFIFFEMLLQYYHFDVEQTLKRVCLPAYSEHVCPKRQAIDFITTEGISDDFDKTPEYLWLQKNAQKFGFYESYPRNNSFGMMYEPWHWHHEE